LATPASPATVDKELAAAQQSCNRAATELLQLEAVAHDEELAAAQQSCNRAATELLQLEAVSNDEELAAFMSLPSVRDRTVGRIRAFNPLQPAIQPASSLPASVASAAGVAPATPAKTANPLPASADPATLDTRESSRQVAFFIFFSKSQFFSVFFPNLFQFFF
jgi:hypothetical protein